MPRTLPLRKIGPLEVIEIPGSSDGSTVVFFHGYGADATDLVPLSQVLSVPAGTRWLFPNGTLPIQFGPGYFARGWFPIDEQAMEAARMAGSHRDFTKQSPQGLKKARMQAFEMLDALKIPLSKVVLGGFSQGAMLATDMALRSEIPPLGLVILSGTLLDEQIWAEKAKLRRGLPFFQSHGTADELLGFQYAQRLEKMLTDSGLKGKLQVFEGGHAIPQEIIYELSRFLKSLLK